MANGWRITKAEWTRLGGLRNSALYRKADNRGAWRYYLSKD